MDKRYQVFVSSTYQDLQRERQEVMHALLELDCIPSGMELFPASNEDQWSLIKKVIDDCDYYILILAGRYGSIGPSGMSYTEMEYRYAMEIEKPVIAFLHKAPSELSAQNSEDTDEGKRKLKAFRALLETRLCKHWQGYAELGSVVSRSLVRLIKTAPGIGWVRANEIADGVAASEMLRLRNRIDVLEAELGRNKSKAPEGTEGLSKGSENFTLQFEFDGSDPTGKTWYWTEYPLTLTWDELMYDIGPLLYDALPEAQLRNALNKVCEARSEKVRAKNKSLKEYDEFKNFKVAETDFQTIKIQLRALGIIRKNDLLQARGVTCWSLTEYGETLVTRLRAIPSKDPPPDF